jgi:energy-coupling factor transporter ATP-binding protein EcfA2
LWHEERVTYRDGHAETKRIEDVAPAESVVITPLYEKYGLRVNPRVLPRLKAMSSQFAYALNVPQTTVEVDGNVVYVRVPRPHGEAEETLWYERAWSIAPDIPVGSLLLGVDEEQSQLVLELISPTNVHALVVGQTGSGKSTLLKTMILSAEMIGGARVCLFDPTGGLRPLSGHPAVWRGGLFQTPEECEAGLEALVRAMGHSQEALTYVFVDEVPDLIATRPAIKEHLGRLAQAGRHAGIHLVLGAQHPLVSEMGSATMRNIPVRLVGRVTDRTAAYNATGRNDSGAEHLRGKGDFLAATGSAMRRFQAACISPKLIEDWAQRYPPRPPRVPMREGQSNSPVYRLWRTAPVLGGYADHGGGGGGGRPLDDIPAFVVQEIRRYVQEHGQEPSSNWVYRLTRESIPSGGFNRAKARRAVDAALGDGVSPAAPMMGLESARSSNMTLQRRDAARRE